MLIDFDKIKEEVQEKFHDGDGEFISKQYFDGYNKILFGKLKKNNSIGLHEHETTSEIVYVISGQGVMTCDGEVEIIMAGDVSYCPMGHNHTLKNPFDEDLEFFAVIPNHKS